MNRYISDSKPDERLLRVIDLRTFFFTRRGIVRAVDGVTFDIDRGEAFGLVGESGSGKSCLCRSILRLVPQPAGRIIGGKVIFEGEDLLLKKEKDMRHLRGARLAMIVQDPLSSLDPMFTVGEQLAEPLREHRRLSGPRLWRKVLDLLNLLRIAPAEQRARDYPHQISGGMRQRVVSAMGLSCGPALLVCDEPTTSLDTTMQAQFVKHLKSLQQEFGMSVLFVTHDLGIAARLCHRVGVMYAGKLVETAKVDDLFSRPLHPYTVALLDCLPSLHREPKWLPWIAGEPPKLHDLPPGCPFSPRCTCASSNCFAECPPLVEVSDLHEVACWKSAASASDSEEYHE